jgi:hypothetical protein
MPVNTRMRDYLDHLQELLMSDINPKGISNLTQKHYDKRISEGNTGIKVASVHLSFPKLLEIGFEVESSYDDDNQVSASGQWIGGHDPHYMSYMSFEDVDQCMSPDFMKLPRQIQIQQLEAVFNQCKIRVYCNCPAFYWQGHSEDIAKRGGLMMKYMGAKGNGIWRNRHVASGGLAHGLVRVCKHLYQCTEEIDGMIVQIIAKMSVSPAQYASVPAGQSVPFPITDNQGQPVAAQPDTLKVDAAATPEIKAPPIPEMPDTVEEISEEPEEEQQFGTIPQEAQDEEVGAAEEEIDIEPEEAVEELEKTEDDDLDQPLGNIKDEWLEQELKGQARNKKLQEKLFDKILNSQLKN